MIELCITVDTESSERSFLDDGTPLHLGFERDVWTQCDALERLAARFDAPFTFFYPLDELTRSDDRAAALAARLALRHELGVHLHRPFAAWSGDRIGAALEHERLALERVTGAAAVSVRAGGYNTGAQERWIAAAAQAGLAVDSSVWSGASATETPSLAPATRHLEHHWGPGAVAYDYRGAPIAGAYRAAADSLVRPGAGPLLEAPIAAAFEEPTEPGPFRLDPRRMPAGLLLESLELLERLAPARALVVVFLHSNGIAHNGRLSAIGRRLERVLEWAAVRGAPVRTLGSLAGLDLADYGPIWGLNQAERWPGRESASLAALVRRCPRCAAHLEELTCPACGWHGARRGPSFVDARASADEPPVPAVPAGRGARRLRAALAITGGVLGSGLGEALYPLARARRLLRRR